MYNTLASAVNLYLKNLDPKVEITNNEIKNLKEITHTCINPKSISKEEL